MAKMKRPHSQSAGNKHPGAQSVRPRSPSRRNATPRNEREAHARERALAAISAMRRDGLSLRAAAKAEGTDPGTVRRYAGTALRRDSPGGRYIGIYNRKYAEWYAYQQHGLPRYSVNLAVSESASLVCNVLTVRDTT